MVLQSKSRTYMAKDKKADHSLEDQGFTTSTTLSKFLYCSKAFTKTKIPTLNIDIKVYMVQWTRVDFNIHLSSYHNYGFHISDI